MDLYGSELTSYNIPIKHLDYDYVRECTNVGEIEKIIKVLRSGKEGKFPDLEKFTEDRLRELKPDSKVLRKPERPAIPADLNKEEWLEIDSDLKQWMNDVKCSEASLQSVSQAAGDTSGDTSLPPVRGSTSIPSNKETLKLNQAANKDKRVKPREYREWDKFDIDAELRKVEETTVGGGDGDKSSSSREKTMLSETPLCNELDAQLQQVKANREKDKGNEAFRAGDLEEALLYYTRSINLLPSVAAINNRAQTYVKLKNWSKALEDCNTVLKMEPDNVKALFRRGAANQGLTRYVQARDDLEAVVKREPNNKNAKELLKSVEKSLAEQKVKGRRMIIEEVSGSEDESDESSKKTSSSNQLITEVKESNNKVTGEDKKLSAGNALTSELQINDITNSNNVESGVNKLSEKFSDRTDNNIADKCSSVKSVSASSSKKAPNEISIDMSSNSVAISDSVECKSSVQYDPSLYPDAVTLINQAHPSYKSGQYGEAFDKFNKAIELLIGYKAADVYLEVLYANRASCHMKLGDCRACVRDCNTSMAIHPNNKHVLLLRASAYELMDKFLEAYVDYMTVSSATHDVVARRGSDRCSSMLKQVYGQAWREKLPKTSSVSQLTTFRSSYGPFSRSVHDSPNVSSNNVGASAGASSPTATETLNKIKTSAEVVTPALTTDSLSAAKAATDASLKVASDAPTSADLRLKSSAADVTASDSISTASKPAESSTAKEELFEKCKNEGNSHFSKGEFKKAVELFTRCSEIYPDRVVPYTNRALCHLRLKQYDKVLDDCNQALGLDFQNIKALFRRAQAYRLLDQWDQSIIDLETLLMIDKGNTAAKKELAAVLQDKEDDQEKRAHLVLLKEEQQRQQRRAAAAAAAKSAAAAASGDGSKAKQSPRSQLDKQSAGEGVVEEEKKSAGRKCKKGSSDEKKRSCVKGEKSLSPYEFLQSWTSLRQTSDIKSYVDLLLSVKPCHLKSVISNKLEGEFLNRMVQCISDLVQSGKADLAADYLKELPNLERFDIVYMFLSDSEKKDIKELFNTLEQCLPDKDILAATRQRFTV